MPNERIANDAYTILFIYAASVTFQESCSFTFFSGFMLYQLNTIAHYMLSFFFINKRINICVYVHCSLLYVRGEKKISCFYTHASHFHLFVIEENGRTKEEIKLILWLSIFILYIITTVNINFLMSVSSFFFVFIASIGRSVRPSLVDFTLWRTYGCVGYNITKQQVLP